MPWRACDFDCSECGCEYEDLIHKETGVWPFDPVLACPKCGHENHQKLAAPNVAAFSIMSREFQMDLLKKRSADHSKKENRKNVDQIREKMNNGRGAKIKS